MEDYRYPIGKFQRMEKPTPELRHQWMEHMLETGGILRNTVQALTHDQLQTPYRDGGWTIQQVVHHMADNNMNAFTRFKRALTEESPIASSYREDLWAELSDYQIPVETSLVLLESINVRFAVILRSLQPSDFLRTFTSPTHGMLDLDEAVQRYVWHDRHHTGQIVSLKNRMGW